MQWQQQQQQQQHQQQQQQQQQKHVLDKSDSKTRLFQISSDQNKKITRNFSLKKGLKVGASVAPKKVHQ